MIFTGVAVKPVVGGKLVAKKDSGSTVTIHGNTHAVSAVTGVCNEYISCVPSEVEVHDGFLSTTVHLYRTVYGTNTVKGTE